MKRKLFAPEQVIAILHEAKTGKLSVAELSCKSGINEVTFCRWRSATSRSMRSNRFWQKKPECCGAP